MSASDAPQDDQSRPAVLISAEHLADLRRLKAMNLPAAKHRRIRAMLDKMHRLEPLEEAEAAPQARELPPLMRSVNPAPSQRLRAFLDALPEGAVIEPPAFMKREAAKVAEQSASRDEQ